MVLRFRIKELGSDGQGIRALGSRIYECRLWGLGRSPKNA